mgnify:CR=1 FL=1
MRIARVLFVPGVSGFFFDDQRAIKRGAVQDGAVYAGAPATEGFRRVREAGRSLSVVLVLDDGQTAVGDCAAVQYSGAGGRDPLFIPERYLPALDAHVRPLLEGADLRADGRGADVQRFGALGEAQATGHGLEGAQCIERDRVHGS